MSLVFIYNHKGMEDKIPIQEKIKTYKGQSLEIGYIINENEFKRDLVNRLELLHLEYRIDFHSNMQKLHFEGKRIIEEINNYIEKEEDKINNDKNLFLNFYWYSCRRYKSICISPLLKKSQVTAFKRYLMENIFKLLNDTMY